MAYFVKDIFKTLQGEGLNSGRAAVFCRMQGCNLWTGRVEDRHKGGGACAQWCDTSFFRGEKLEFSQILARAEALWSPGSTGLVVLTGGEPALQADEELICGFDEAAWGVAVETNGTVENKAIIDHADFICLSPKLGGEVHSSYWGEASEVKVVLPGHHDPLQGWQDMDLLQMAQRAPQAKLWVSPMDPPLSTAVEDTYLHPKTILQTYSQPRKKFEENLKRCIDFVMKYPQFALTHQAHKSWHLP